MKNKRLKIIERIADEWQNKCLDYNTFIADRTAKGQSINRDQYTKIEHAQKASLFYSAMFLRENDSEITDHLTIYYNELVNEHKKVVDWLEFARIEAPLQVPCLRRELKELNAKMERVKEALKF